MKRLILIAIPVCIFIILSCQKEYSIETGSANASTGTLKDSLGDCNPITISGTYTEGQNLTATNFVNVTVIVSGAGNYKISTDTLNGFYFSDAGYFAAAGTYVVKLLGGGKPILPVATDFTVSYGSSFCQFSITPGPATSGTLNSADTAWMFNEGSQHFQGHVDSALFKTNGTVAFLNIYGKPATNDTTFYVQLQQASLTSPPAPGSTYSTSSGTAVFEFKTATGTTIYDSRQTDGSNLVFTIVAYNPTTKVLDATFTGTVKDNAAGTKTVTAGKLKLTTQ